MHVWTHLKKAAEGTTGIGIYPDGMVEHDDMVGALLKQLDDLGIADNTIVVYSHRQRRRDRSPGPTAARRRSTARRARPGRAASACRLLVRWPGVIKPGTIYNDIISQEDWMPTLLAAAGEPDIVEKLKKGYKANGKTFKVHADGYNFLPYFKGEAQEGTARGDLLLRPGRRAERRALERLEGPLRGRQTATSPRRRAKCPGWPLIVNLRADPYEKAPHESGAVHPLVRGQHLAVRAGAGRSSRSSSRPSRSIPFQQGSSLNAAGINYHSLQAMQAMKRLKELETLRPPSN